MFVLSRKMRLYCFVFVFCFARTVVTIKNSKVKKGWDVERYDLPEGFRYGVVTSAYQIEGAWNEDGKGESIWDRYLQTKPEQFAPGPNGTDACDSYRNYMRDVEMLREIGVDFYSFSMAWSRILPTGFADNINVKGLEYYKKLTDELYKYKILAIVTMYHNDLPQALQDLGGWTNPDIVDWFVDYARILFTFFPHVSYWIPIHEPSVCFKMYDSRANNPPGLDAKGTDDYLCVKHMLLAHAKVYRMYHEEFSEDASRSLVGMALALNWADPYGYKSDNPELVSATNTFREFTIDLYLHPLYEGDWPPLVKKMVAQNSKEEGLTTSRLPKFTKNEIELIKGTCNFIGLNYYTTYFIELPPGGVKFTFPRFPKDIKVDVTQNTGWAPSKTPGIRSAPYGFHRLCVYINQRYGHLPMIITEFGWSTDPGRFDKERVEIMFEFLKAVILAFMEGSDLRGLAIWSLMDNIEWTAGVTQRYGLYEVDFESPNKTRTPRLSAHYFRQLIETHLIKDEWEPYAKNLSLDINPRKKEVRDKTEL